MNSIVVHVCHDLDSALTEIPALLRGEPVESSSDLSSNSQAPKAVVIGKGFTEEEMDRIIKAGKDSGSEKAASVAWLLPDDEKFTYYQKAKAIASAGTLLPSVIADRVRDCMKEHDIVPGKESAKGGVFGF